METHELAVIQGMLDARKQYELQAGPENKTVVCPFDPLTQSEQYDYWWSGYNTHRDPKMVE